MFLFVVVESVLELNKMPTAFKIYWAMHSIALTMSFVVTIIYWGVLHNGEFGYLLKSHRLLIRHFCYS